MPDWLTSISSMCSHCLGLSSEARNAIRSKAVNLVWRRDDTKTKTGLSGEWVLTAVNQRIHIRNKSLTVNCNKKSQKCIIILLV